MPVSSSFCGWLSGLGSSVGMGTSPEVHERGTKRVNEATSRHSKPEMVVILMNFNTELKINGSEPCFSEHLEGSKKEAAHWVKRRATVT